MWLNKFSSVLIAVLFIFSIMILSFPRPSLAVARLDSPKASNHYLVSIRKPMILTNPGAHWRGKPAIHSRGVPVLVLEFR